MSKAPLADKGTPKFVDIGDNEPTGAIRVFSLNDEIVPKDVAEHIQLGEHNLRRETADRIIGLFVRINAATLLTFLVLFVSDVWLIHSGSEKPTERLIDSGVVKMLIAATTVQLGAAVALIMAYLFPGASKNRAQSEPKS